MGVEGVHQKQWHIAAVLLVECLKKKEAKDTKDQVVRFDRAQHGS
jgi:hypothetical protein